MTDDASDFGSDEEIDELTALFDKACKLVEQNASVASDNDLLELYGYFKIATNGPCEEPKPWFLQVRALKKWEAWKKLGLMSRDDAKRKYIEIARSLMGEIADDKNKTQTGEVSKAKSGWINVSSMARTGSDENIADDNPVTQAFAAVKKNNVTTLKRLLSDNPSLISEQDSGGLSLIHWACDRGFLDVLKTLVEYGADVNAKTSDDGQTPLHYAASCGHAPCVSFLLENKANKYAVDNEGLEPGEVAEGVDVAVLLQ